MRARLAGLGLAAAGLALATLPPSAAAQVQRPWEIGGGASFEQYEFTDPDQAGLDRLTLRTVPFGARTRIGGGFYVSAQGAWAEGEVTRPGGETLLLSGPTDTEVRLGWMTGAGGIRVEVAGFVPTGEATHDDMEAVVAGIVSADLLPLRISHWGTGGGIATSASVAQSWGALGLGASASYRISQEFEPVEGEDFRYQPGNELTARVAADLSLGERSKLSLSGGMRRFDADLANDQNLFQTGDRLEALATFSFPVGLRSAGALYGSVIRREQGSFLLGGSGEVPAQNLVLAGGLVRLPIAGAFFTPRIDARLFQPAEGLGGGAVVGAGASLEIPLGSSLTLLPSATGRVGAVELLPGEASTFTGWQGALTVRFGPRTAY